MYTAVKQQGRKRAPLFTSLARPRSFRALSGILLPASLVMMILLLSVGLYAALVSSPPDYQQGEAVRIMYVHVPASWMSLMVYGFVAVMSFIVLVWRHPMADILAISSVPVGALFTTLSLATGSLWGMPMWGTYWVWDARLTSVLALLFFYAGYWMLYKGFSRGIRAASILALVGTVNLPIIKGSVDWWNTLHQPASIMKMGPSALHQDMLTPLLLMAGAYFFYFVSVLLMRTQIELRMRKQRARDV